jgi:hypothetical protein
MATITRRLPKSNISRDLAIRQAENRMTIVLPADMALTPNTQTRLTNMRTDYGNGKQAVSAVQ